MGHARRSAGLTILQVADALELNPRTVRRWERGEAIPREQQWLRILTFYAARDPSIVEALAACAERVLPQHLRSTRVAPPTVSQHAAPSGAKASVDPLVASHVVATAADALDLAPKKIRAVLRAAVRAAADAGVSVECVALAVSEDAVSNVG